MKKPTAIVTSGPTREKIDPVRYISNFSSGIQGHAIAGALAAAGFEVILIAGPVSIPSPKNVKTINVQTADEMLAACLGSLPADVAVCVAAVCDFKPEIVQKNKIKKHQNTEEISIKLVQNPDILQTISTHQLRPKLVIGFAAETENVIENAKQKLAKKSCDLIVANDVSGGDVFGSCDTNITIISPDKTELHGPISKADLADLLVKKISNFLGTDVI